MDQAQATTYRRAAARLNYITLDRADLSYASKEASRGMSNPTVGDVIRLKRILRYLKSSPRAVTTYRWQDPVTCITGFSDSDWAGCVKTRRSTSGGFLLIGLHLISHWSSTQAVVALSSAEAELNALVKTASESLGLKNLLKDLKRETHINLNTDSSASNGMVHREGCGKVKHLEARQLWIQDYVVNKLIDVHKIPRDLNCADCLTHSWSAVDGIKHLSRVGLKMRSSPSS